MKKIWNWIVTKYNVSKADFHVKNYNPLNSIDDEIIKTANHFRISHQYDRYRFWKLLIILALLVLAIWLIRDMYFIINDSAQSSYNIMLCSIAKNKDICVFLLDRYNKHYYLKSDVIKYIILFHCSAIAVLGFSIKSLFVHQFNNNLINDTETKNTNNAEKNNNIGEFSGNIQHDNNEK